MSDNNSWADYVSMVREKGVLALELYVVHSKPIDGLDGVRANHGPHLAYQKEIEQKGIMFGAGPLADEQGEQWSGEGFIIIRAPSLEAAKEIADNDPMHKNGGRSYTIRPWLLNEGCLNVQLTYSDGGRKIT
jgi:uncharacterized protein YciI